jgi:group II intron reverse transcriptase/maturase
VTGTTEKKVREVCVMQTAKTYLELIGERGKKDVPLERVYRQLFNRDLYLKAYGKIYRNNGAMTPGTTEETADGMTLAKIDGIIELLRSEKYRWTPVRRVYIEKKNSSKKRPLGIPTWSDKLLQEVIRLILESYYEPQFSRYSHGFRPEKGTHTALRDIYRTWTGTNWFIEGDIKACFDTLNHEVLIATLAEKIKDERFLRLIQELLQAGYLEDWKYNTTYSGSPQGGIVSPILANIYLDKLDKFVEEKLIPEYTRGTKKKANPQYKSLEYQARTLRDKGFGTEAWEVRKEMKKIPSLVTDDPNYRRLNYTRYADDFLLGFLGPKCEAEAIKQRLAEYIQTELQLELSEAKTLITHARTEKAKFLGYEISVQHDDNVRDPKGSTYKARRRTNGAILLSAPESVIREKCLKCMQKGKPVHRKEMEKDTPFSIIAGFQAEYRGIVEYYRLAANLSRFNRLRWVMEMSLTKTLASKLKISVSQVYRKFKTVIKTEERARKVLQVVIPREGKKPLIAQWGGITLKRKMNATPKDDKRQTIWSQRSELEQRLLADKCEQCGSTDQVQVHHIRALKDLEQYGRNEKPNWVKIMAARHRKTLIVCHTCHVNIHAGRSKPPSK